jgi:copper(I)-binding protein
MLRTAFAAFMMLTSFAAAAGDAPFAITVTDVWMRASLGKVPTTAAYLKIENHGAVDERLLSVSTPAAAMAHLHNSESADGIVRMSAMSALTVKPGETIELSPGGLHIMVMNLKAPLKVGDKVPMTLRFEKAGPMDVEAEVRGLDGAPHKH